MASATKLNEKTATSILQFMEPNLRFRINQQILALRDLEYDAPLKLNRLTLENSQMLVNDTIYKVVRNQYVSMGSGSKPEKTSFLDVTIKSKKTYKERLRTNYDVICAMMAFSDIFFNFRAKPIKVKHLEITGNVQKYLQQSTKFIVQDLKLLHKHFKSNIHLLEPFLSKESFPLKTVFLHGDRAEPNVGSYQHEWIEGAEYLQISDSSERVSWLPTLSVLKNTNVHLECYSFGKSSCVKLIETWLDEGREIGAFFSIGCKSDEMIVGVLCELAKLEGAVMENNVLFGCRKFQKLVYLPMKDDKKLCIYISKNLKVKQLSFSEWDINLCVFAKDD
ncbi:unnamed protein product [Caenorhabditis brenneri]